MLLKCGQGAFHRRVLFYTCLPGFLCHSSFQFDQEWDDPYNGGFTVKHFFRFDELFFQPGGNPLGCVVLWRLFRGAHSSDVRLE
jgi:hypothetical protein